MRRRLTNAPCAVLERSTSVEAACNTHSVSLYAARIRRRRRAASTPARGSTPRAPPTAPVLAAAAPPPRGDYQYRRRSPPGGVLERRHPRRRDSARRTDAAADAPSPFRRHRQPRRRLRRRRPAVAVAAAAAAATSPHYAPPAHARYTQSVEVPDWSPDGADVDPPPPICETSAAVCLGSPQLRVPGGSTMGLSGRIYCVWVYPAQVRGCGHRRALRGWRMRPLEHEQLPG